MHYLCNTKALITNHGTRNPTKRSPVEHIEATRAHEERWVGEWASTGHFQLLCEKGNRRDGCPLGIWRVEWGKKWVDTKRASSYSLSTCTFIKSFSTPTVFWQVSPLKARTSVSCETFKPGVQEAECCLHSYTPKIVQSSRFKVQSSKFKVQSSRFKVQGSKFKVQSLADWVGCPQRRRSRRSKLCPFRPWFSSRLDKAEVNFALCSLLRKFKVQTFKLE